MSRADRILLQLYGGHLFELSVQMLSSGPSERLQNGMEIQQPATTTPSNVRSIRAMPAHTAGTSYIGKGHAAAHRHTKGRENRAEQCE